MYVLYEIQTQPQQSDLSVLAVSVHGILNGIVYIHCDNLHHVVSSSSHPGYQRVCRMYIHVMNYWHNMHQLVDHNRRGRKGCVAG